MNRTKKTDKKQMDMKRDNKTEYEKL